MYPYTAINLKESNSNSMKDFLSLVDVYGFSHMMMFTNTEKHSYLKLMKMPKGPTITFKIKGYCLSNDIYNNSKFKIPLTKNFDHIPIIIMNGFNSVHVNSSYQIPIQTTSMMFQSFFPPLNLQEIQMKKCKRVVLVSMNADEKGIPLFSFRHYEIEIEKSSMKKTISNVINGKTILGKNLSKFDNIADYILKQSGFTSQSDNDDQNLGNCTILNDESQNKNDNIKIILKEIGPRLDLILHKIEEGFLKGNVLFHSLIKRTKKEIQEIFNEIKQKKQQKKMRIIQQEKNIKQKDKKISEIKNDYIKDYNDLEQNNQKLLGKKVKRENSNKI